MAEKTRDLFAEGVLALERAGIASPRRNVEWMLCEVTGLGRAALYARLDEQISPRSLERFRAMLERRSRHEPIQHILGYAEFYGLRLEVSPAVLVPRPETEQVVEEALRVLETIDAPRVFDVGTGSGCIALAIKHNRPDATVTACDVSPAALAVASSNAVRLQLDIDFMQLDLFAPRFGERAPDVLDLLISNPPYIAESDLKYLPAEVRDYEPRLALAAPSDPLIFYRRLGDLGMDLLDANRHIVLETAADCGDEAAEMLRLRGYGKVTLKRDYAGQFRILDAVRPSRLQVKHT